MENQLISKNTAKKADLLRALHALDAEVVEEVITEWANVYGRYLSKAWQLTLNVSERYRRRLAILQESNNRLLQGYNKEIKQLQKEKEYYRKKWRKLQYSSLVDQENLFLSLALLHEEIAYSCEEPSIKTVKEFEKHRDKRVLQINKKLRP